ncbi:hypothetical protein Tco_0213458 [Tanacetum coccineum]
MNPQETQQVIVHDEKWVPSTKRVKISPTNVRLETTEHQKEETFQVIIDVKNSMCFKAFPISAEVPEIFMQQKILDICLRVEGEEFTKVQDDDATLTFLIDLGYKGPLHKYTSMYVDHMHQPWRTLEAIINKCLSGKTGSNDRLRKSRSDTLWGMFYRENEYGLPIPDMMLKDKIKQSDSYQMFLTYSTGLIPSKKSRGKGSQGKKTADVSQELVDVSDEFEPELAKKKTSSRSTRGVVIQDTPSALKPKPAASKLKPKGTRGSSEGTGRIPGVPDESTLAFAISSEVTSTKPGVSDEEKVTLEENVILEWGSKNESKHSEDSQLNSDEEEKKDNDGDANHEDEDDDHISDIQDTDDEYAKTESNDNEIYKYKIQVYKDVDVEMVGAETVKRENIEKDEMTNAAKADVGKTAEEKGDAELAENDMTSNYQVKVSIELPLPSSSLSVSSGFGTHFLNLSSNVSLIGVLKDSLEAEISSLMDVHIQQETPQIQSLSVLKVPVSVILETTTLPPILEIPIETLVSTALSPPHVTPTISIVHQITTPIPTPPITTEAPTSTTAVLESDVLSVVQLRVAKLEKDVFELKKIDHSAEALASLKSQVPTIVENYLGSKIGDDLQKIKKEQAEKQKMPKYIIKSTDKATLKEYDLKSTLYQTMNENKSFNRNPANHALYLIEDENDDDEDPSVRPKNGKKTKRKRTKESESSMKPSTTKETSKGKALSKNSKTSKCATTKEPIEEPIAEVVMDDLENNTNEDVVNDVDRPQDDPWFNCMVAAKDPLTFDELMATPIDFSKYAMNRLQIDNLTQEILVGPVYNMLKGTCTSSIELEYNIEECFKALIDRLDWNNPEGDRCPFNLTKPLLVKGRPGHLTGAAEYFFNNDLEFLKLSDPKKKYTTPITKTNAARSEMVGIEDMVSTLWSPTKVRSQINKFSKHNVYSTQKILGVKSVGVKKLLGYDHLEEIVVKRDDRQLYTFKESDFVDLHLNDIEDMIFIIVQHKLFHLDSSDINKLNIAEPEKNFPEIKFKELFTPSHKPLGVIYEDLNKHKRVMCADELYKFLDRTLNNVRDELHHRILNFCLGYNKEMSRRK